MLKCSPVLQLFREYQTEPLNEYADYFTNTYLDLLIDRDIIPCYWEAVPDNTHDLTEIYLELSKYSDSELLSFSPVLFRYLTILTIAGVFKDAD